MTHNQYNLHSINVLSNISSCPFAMMHFLKIVFFMCLASLCRYCFGQVMMLTAVKDLRLVRHAMDVYSRLTKNMTPLDFQRTVYTFRYTVFPYWKPDVFEVEI